MSNKSVENTFMEMNRPKVNEIKERFSQGKVLSQEDINTLLLQSQYNHINHLDQGLTSVEAQVKDLKHEFILMEERVNTKFEQVNTRFEEVYSRIERTQSTLIKVIILVMGGLLTIFKVIDLVLV